MRRNGMRLSPALTPQARALRHVLLSGVDPFTRLMRDAQQAARDAGADLWLPLDPAPWRNLYLLGDASTGNASSSDPVGRVNAGQFGGAVGAEMFASFAAANGFSWSNGVLAGTGVAAFATTSGTFAGPMIAGKTYRISYRVTFSSAGAFRFQASGTNTTDNIGQVTSSGSYSFQYSPTENKPFFNAQAGTGGFTGTVDGISIVEVPGNHLTQTTSSARPVAGLMANGRGALTFGTNQKLNSNIQQPSAFTWIIARRLITKNAGFVGGAANAGATAGAWIDTAVTNEGLSMAGGGGSVTTSTPVDLLPHVLTYQHSSAAAAIWRDGVQIGSRGAGSVVTASDALFSLGGAGVNNNSYMPQAEVALCCVAPAVISTEQRRAIERFGASLIGATYAG